MTQRSGTVTFRVVTWNILHGVDVRRGRVDVPAVADTLAGLQADIVALQEVDRGLARSGGVDQAAAIAGALQLHAAFAPALLGDPDTAWLRPRGHDRGGGGYGVALLSRLPLVAVQRVDLPGGGDGRRPRPTTSAARPGWDREPRVGVRATVAVGGREVTVATTHLSYLPWRGLRQLRRLTRALASASPAVLLGDFNLPPPAVALAARGWTGAGGAPTYPASAPRVQVDQVLVKDVQVVDVRVGEAATGDHRPVVADLIIP